MSYLDLEDEPACWSWDLPPLPQVNSASSIRAWQAARCAACGSTGAPLDEDHDHQDAAETTRGFLCKSCNTDEGQPGAHRVWRVYRVRHPAAILGVQVSYHGRIHPAVRIVNETWEIALRSLLARVTSGRDAPELSPLAKAADAVGWTYAEWVHKRAQWRQMEQERTQQLLREISAQGFEVALDPPHGGPRDPPPDDYSAP